MNRRQTLVCVLLLGAGLLEGCNFVNAATEKPKIQLRLDAPVSEVQANSSYQFPSEFLEGVPGKEFITVPHVLVYQDDTLTLRIDDAGGLRTLPTNIGYSVRVEPTAPESTVNYIGVHVLPDYSPLPVALARARALRDALLAQGFVVETRPWKDRFNANWEAAPTHLDAFEDLEAAFLNSAFYAKRASVFDMSKGKINVELLLINGRRLWGSRTDRTDDMNAPAEKRAAKEASSMGRQDLLAEPVYSLELSVGPSNEWMKQRSELNEAERKKRQGVK